MAIHGWILVNKPEGLSSTQVGTFIKRLSHTKKLGHVGTLDPFATGLLPLALGEATKIIPYVNTNIKEYIFELTFGQARDTYDKEGKITAESDVRPTYGAIKKNLPQFQGEITQKPPLYSALRIQGERAYTLARQGISFDLVSRKITIYELEIIGENLPHTVHFRVLCSQGTYVRTLGHDLAMALGTVGYVSSLFRTRVGKFTHDHAFLLDNLKEKGHISNESSCVLPIRAVLDDIPAVSVSEMEEARVRQGQSIPVSPHLKGHSLCLLMTQKGELSLAGIKEKGICPLRVFNFSI